jgi:hypothetical protein
LFRAKTEKEKPTKKIQVILALCCHTIAFISAAGILTEGQALVQQNEAEFQKLMPVTGSMDTFFGESKLDHSFPKVGMS